ncbi:MAG: VOC family protein [Bacteroidota bacterium]
MLPNPKPFLDKIFADLAKHSYLEVSPYPIDHICYRVASMERYFELKTALLSQNELLTESIINGRPIATFRLQEAIKYREQNIELLELPSPKPGSDYPEGYEHIEFVIGEDPAKWIGQFPALDWDKKGLQKAINSDVRLKLSNGYSVKFHEHPLDYVIEFLD